MAQTVPAQADLALRLYDGDPFDRLQIRNLGACAVVEGELHVDLSGSAGQLILDTVRGGSGTKDPMPVEVERGAIVLAPVADGAQALQLYIQRLGPQETARVTMDLDNSVGWWPGARVSFQGDQAQGSVARLELEGGTVEAVFGPRGTARLRFAETPCGADDAPVEGPVETVPIS